MVVAADGNSTRLSMAMGLAKRDDRPMGVAVRTYYRSPRHHDDYLESWLELWDGKPGQSDLLPGYGWIFGMGDGTCNVGLGILNTSSAFGKTDYKDLLKRWLDNTPEEWGFRDENMTHRSAARPCRWASTASRTTPAACCWSVTPAAWSTRSTARASRTRWSRPRSRPTRWPRRTTAGSAPERRAGAAVLPGPLKAELGGYYTLGRVFVKLIGNPQVMRACTKYGLPRKTLMRFTLKLLANLTTAGTATPWTR